MSEIDLYNFDLPEQRIAQYPLENRADARLLVVDRQAQSWQTHHVRDLPEILDRQDMLVMNDTKVVPARLVGFRQRTGGKWTGLFLEADPSGLWRVLGKTRGKLESGEQIVLVDHAQAEAARLTLVQRLSGGAWLAKPSESGPPWELLEQIGRVPLPPYIRGGEMEESDRGRYQTVYAERPGAVAAPTAGLHFTRSLLDRLQQQGVATERVTLHVGEGTFRPVQTDSLEEHPMHAEWGELNSSTAAAITAHRRQGGRLVAIGTTTVRVLESAASASPPAESTPQAWTLHPWSGETDLFIRPPYQFQVVDALLTNFHLPRSTLMVLVCTLGGRELILDAYQYAIAEKFRFYSYGDAMLIL